jgi:F-type H+-transporting ATPase subunit b
MRPEFELNTDLFETNVLNLSVVVGVVVTVIGDAARSVLEDRQKMIILQLQEADQAVQEIEVKLEEARKCLETNKLQAQDIRTQAKKLVEQEKFLIQKQLDSNLEGLITKLTQSVQVEQQRIVKVISQQVASLSLEKAICKIKESISFSKSVELNEQYVRKRFLNV